MASTPNFLHEKHRQVILGYVRQKVGVVVNSNFYNRMKTDYGMTKSNVDRAINALVSEEHIKFRDNTDGLIIEEVQS